MEDWIKIRDAKDLPEEKMGNVLVYIPKNKGTRQHGVYIGCVREMPADDGSGNFWGIPIKRSEWTIWGWSYFEHPTVTHWRPLPAGPADEPEVQEER